MNEDKCLRCGQCCYYMKNNKLNRCRFLVKLPSGKTLCRNYKSHVGTVLCINDDGNTVMCVPRIMWKVNYPNCPYNKDDWKENKQNAKNN